MGRHERAHLWKRRAAKRQVYGDIATTAALPKTSHRQRSLANHIGKRRVDGSMRRTLLCPSSASFTTPSTVALEPRWLSRRTRDSIVSLLRHTDRGSVAIPGKHGPKRNLPDGFNHSGETAAFSVAAQVPINPAAGYTARGFVARAICEKQGISTLVAVVDGGERKNDASGDGGKLTRNGLSRQGPAIRHLMVLTAGNDRTDRPRTSRESAWYRQAKDLHGS